MATVLEEAEEPAADLRRRQRLHQTSPPLAACRPAHEPPTWTLVHHGQLRTARGRRQHPALERAAQFRLALGHAEAHLVGEHANGDAEGGQPLPEATG